MQRANGVRVIAGLSGGVDSAVAALRLRDEGFDVQGLFMNNWDDEDAYCTRAQDYQDARTTARDLGIVLHRVSFAAEYRERVFAYFLSEYQAGRTPNPDVLCNREIKFGVCLAYARRLGAEGFATGHYARVEQLDDGPALFKGADPGKDQSYFLHAVARGDFTRVLFPLGQLTKTEVRGQALRAGLAVHDKPDSTGICFIGERPFADFLARFIPAEPGPIETADGRVLGTHRGLPFYTLGQRGGLHIGGARGRAEDPWYVARKDLKRNTLIVMQRHEQAQWRATGLRTGAVNWLTQPPAAPFLASVKIRYRQPDQPARITPLPNGAVAAHFVEPQQAVTPGQFAVLYAEERCLGGGVIEETL